VIASSERIAVAFEATDGLGFISRVMSNEDSEYYTLGTVYLINATTP
jgi:hypothetical protein